MPDDALPPLSPSVGREVGTMGDGSGRRITYYSWRGGTLPTQQVSVPAPGPAPEDP
jgi:hypothetical protein